MANSEKRETQGRTRRRLGIGLCAVAVLAACTAKERDYSKLLPSGGEGGAHAALGAAAGSEGDTPPEGDAGATAAAGRSSESTGGDAGASGETGGSGPTPSTGGRTVSDGGTDPGPAGSGGVSPATGGVGPATGGVGPPTGGSAGSATSAAAGEGGAGSPTVEGGAAGDTAGGAGGAFCETSDPARECVGGVVQARDADEDTHGDMNCVEAPGDDCDDADDLWVTNECGGCAVLSEAVGDACGDCGELGRDATLGALQCVSPTPQPRLCNENVVAVCEAGYWSAVGSCASDSATSTPVCYEETCVVCLPGTYRCQAGVVAERPDDEVIWRCGTTGSWEASWIASCYASSSEVCNAATLA